MIKQGEGDMSFDTVSDDEWFQIYASLPKEGLRSPIVPLETLWIATQKSFNEITLVEIIENPNLDGELAEYILDNLAQGYSQVLYRLLKNPVTPVYSVFKLWLDPSFETYRRLIINSEKATPSMVWLGLMDSDPQTRSAAKLRLNPVMHKKVLVHGLKHYAGVEDISEDLPLDWLIDIADNFGINLL